MSGKEKKVKSAPPETKTCAEIDAWIKSAIDLKATHLPKEWHFEFKKRKHSKWVPLEVYEKRVGELEKENEQLKIYLEFQNGNVLKWNRYAKKYLDGKQELEGQLKEIREILNEFPKENTKDGWGKEAGSVVHRPQIIWSGLDDKEVQKWLKRLRVAAEHSSECSKEQKKGDNKK